MQSEALKLIVDKLHLYFLTAGLEPKPAGQVVYYSEQANCFVLAVHLDLQETKQLAENAWAKLPQEIKQELDELEIGFAVKQI